MADSFGEQQAANAASIAEAIDETDFLSEADPADAEYDEEQDPSEGEAPVEQEAPASTAESTTQDEPAEAPEEGTAEEAPTEYWGIDLEGVPAEKRAELIAGLEQRDSTIHKLQEQFAALRQAAEEAPAPEPEPAEEVDDETLLQAAGFNPEFMDEGSKESTLFILRNQLRLEEQVEQLASARELESVEQQWTTALDALEAQHGTIPFSRDEVLRYAVENRIGDPESAYWRIAGPAKLEATKAISALRRDAEKRVASGNVRPRTVKGEAPQITPKDYVGDLRGAVAEAAKQAQKETGFRWKDALRGRKSVKE